MEEKEQNIRYVMVSSENIQQNVTNDEIDLRELWKAIWQGKWLIIAVTTVCAIGAVLYALSLPNIYKSEALLAPASSDEQAGLSGIAGQFGGLASLAGVSLGGAKADKTALAIQILKSRQFTSQFIQKRNILPELMAVKEWDLSSNKIIYDEAIYSPDTDKWIREAEPQEDVKPSMQVAKLVFDDMFTVQQNKDTGLVAISVEHRSPYVAKQWVDWLIEDINANMKVRDKQEAERSITYLQSQIEKTTVLEHKTLLYQLIEEQAKTLMFAEVREEYVFKTIDPALVPEIKFSPKRAIIVAFATLLAGILGVFVVLFISLFRKQS
ncbi:Wzz/FepE/Etk N-terminal domain-containing protein [Paraglaciecola sp.]|uniref:Wzz/FepE/Etk N-terminal domain-containing protein n=1 Tax=Paraglaciecola sp. TaxID=1920173 RepID=UPI00273FCB68|nr:Wzz/FepE/Etk N-terminal domain-containing protein [Paraglaciecola sp.]MDP5029042.1 Wzz/FepE/Etk N-terminal domain-containing protein [Paraglaciecola sp.]